MAIESYKRKLRSMKRHILMVLMLSLFTWIVFSGLAAAKQSPLLFFVIATISAVLGPLFIFYYIRESHKTTHKSGRKWSLIFSIRDFFLFSLLYITLCYSGACFAAFVADGPANLLDVFGPFAKIVIINPVASGIFVGTIALGLCFVYFNYAVECSNPIKAHIKQQGVPPRQRSRPSVIMRFVDAITTTPQIVDVVFCMLCVLFPLGVTILAAMNTPFAKMACPMLFTGMAFLFGLRMGCEGKFFKGLQGSAFKRNFSRFLWLSSLLAIILAAAVLGFTLPPPKSKTINLIFGILFTTMMLMAFGYRLRRALGYGKKGEIETTLKRIFEKIVDVNRNADLDNIQKEVALSITNKNNTNNSTNTEISIEDNGNIDEVGTDIVTEGRSSVTTNTMDNTPTDKTGTLTTATKSKTESVDIYKIITSPPLDSVKSKTPDNPLIEANTTNDKNTPVKNEPTGQKACIANTAKNTSEHMSEIKKAIPSVP